MAMVYHYERIRFLDLRHAKALLDTRSELFAPHILQLYPKKVFRVFTSFASFIEIYIFATVIYIISCFLSFSLLLLIVIIYPKLRDKSRWCYWQFLNF